MHATLIAKSEKSAVAGRLRGAASFFSPRDIITIRRHSMRYGPSRERAGNFPNNTGHDPFDPRSRAWSARYIAVARKGRYYYPRETEIARSAVRKKAHPACPALVVRFAFVVSRLLSAVIHLSKPGSDWSGGEIEKRRIIGSENTRFSPLTKEA